MASKQEGPAMNDKEKECTFRRLEEDSAKAQRITFNISTDRFIVLSDVHKGDRQKGSDDFERNEALYCCALEFYFKNGFKLVLAGDIEEGWECDLDKIIDCYKDTAFEAEKRFVKANRYYRLHGNHDCDLADKANVDKFLGPVLGNVEVFPALFIGNKIIVVHGHQGDGRSDQEYWVTSRWAVKTFWKFAQNIFGAMNNRAAENNKIRSRRDQCLYEWAKANKLLLIAGHTHRGIFESYSKTFQLFEKKLELEDQLGKTTDITEKLLIKEAMKKIEQIIAESKEELQKEKTASRLEENPVPCYFNDGCCVHTNGISGIEIDHGTIRLVKWELSDTTCATDVEGKIRPANIIGPERRIYQSADLNKILEKIRSTQ
jgi:UDP-2,3-diacylglucosamine pyrophosphatase LpxH